MKNISWYIARLKTMSIPEIFYRVSQQVQTLREKRQPKFKFHKRNDYPAILKSSLDFIDTTLNLPTELTSGFLNYKILNVFGKMVDITPQIDWHLDIDSGKRFPLYFSKDINIRSDEFGSAKVVWEINRLQFLLPLTIKYLDTKNPEDLDLFVDIVENWTSANPYLIGVNWYSNIEVNLRLITWYFCWQVLWSTSLVKSNEKFKLFTINTWLPSIYEHCKYSFSNPSKYSSANNHLISEYSGLFVASNCWPFEEAAKWRDYAMKGMEKEILLQHSANGINKEEAAEYIQFITDFFVVAFSVGKKYDIPFSANYENRLLKIFNYIFNLLDISGGYPKYGDEDDGKVLITSNNPNFNNFESLLISAAVLSEDNKFKLADNKFDLKNWLLWGEAGKNIYDRLSVSSQKKESTFYKEEGHFIFRKAYSEDKHKEIYLHFDAAPLGFLSIAAHGHADALSVILSLDGNSMITDAGTFTYHTHPEWRKYFTSTLAHNTICIDNMDQAEHVGATLWLDHYKTKILEISQQSEIEIVEATHTGFQKIGCSHIRKIEFDILKEIFIITDELITGKKAHYIVQSWLVHPLVKIRKIHEHNYILMHQHGKRSVKIQLDSRLSIIQKEGQLDPILGWYSSSFMQKEAANMLYCDLHTKPGETLKFQTTIQIE
jgi:Heparinase II/III-like protein/Heparinase II/III N-terminus